MPKLNRTSVASPSVGKDMLPYPHVTVNCTVHLERLDPAMLPQTQKKEVSTSSGRRERDKIYRNDMTKGFLLLRKWVPDIENLNRLGMLMETVEYIKELKKKIKELQNKIKELEKETPRESTLQTPQNMGQDSVPTITMHYGTEQESDSNMDCTEKSQLR
jgi:hypothetical protein